TTYEDQTLPEANAEDVVEALELKQFLQDFAPRSDPLEYVINENLIDRRSWKPCVAGILVFNANPSPVVPRRCAVRIARYETREDDPEREHLKETISIEGPLYHQIHRSVETITGIMSSIKIWTTSGLRNVAYPPESIWEIVANAIIHRDYSISDDIQILIFNNRIEVQVRVNSLDTSRLKIFLTLVIRETRKL